MQWRPSHAERSGGGGREGGRCMHCSHWCLLIHPCWYRLCLSGLRVQLPTEWERALQQWVPTALVLRPGTGRYPRTTGAQRNLTRWWPPHWPPDQPLFPGPAHRAPKQPTPPHVCCRPTPARYHRCSRQRAESRRENRPARWKTAVARPRWAGPRHLKKQYSMLLVVEPWGTVGRRCPVHHPVDPAPRWRCGQR